MPETAGVLSLESVPATDYLLTELVEHLEEAGLTGKCFLMEHPTILHDGHSYPARPQSMKEDWKSHFVEIVTEAPNKVGVYSVTTQGGYSDGKVRHIVRYCKTK